jgi:dTDP-4-amino-4,6-dideoxygalactose transaminase
MTTAIPLLDLYPLYAEQKDEIDAAIASVLDRQDFIQGQSVRDFESAILEYLGIPSGLAVGVANGSDAIVLALRALELGAGDEVIVPDFTFLSTATSVSLVGATPVFVDVCGASFNVTAQTVLSGLSARTRAVIVVHLFGGPADVPSIRNALDGCGRQDVTIIEDCAQSLGAKWGSRCVGTMGQLATLSFFPSKNLGAFGDGGMVVSHDSQAAARVRLLGQHGSRTKYFAELLGQNSRLDTIQAAVLLVRLRRLDAWCAQRRHNAFGYLELLSEIPADCGVVLPGEEAGTHHIFNQFTLQVPDRQRWMDGFQREDIGVAVYYPRPLSQQPCFADRPHRAVDAPISARLCEQVLSIPVYPGLSARNLERVARVVAGLAG